MDVLEVHVTCVFGVVNRGVKGSSSRQFNEVVKG